MCGFLTRSSRAFDFSLTTHRRVFRFSPSFQALPCHRHLCTSLSQHPCSACERRALPSRRDNFRHCSLSDTKEECKPVPICGGGHSQPAIFVGRIQGPNHQITKSPSPALIAHQASFDPPIQPCRTFFYIASLSLSRLVFLPSSLPYPLIVTICFSLWQRKQMVTIKV